MKTLTLSAIAAVAIASSAVAQEAEKITLYEDSNREYFATDVQYSKQTDGREHCTLVLLDRQSENVLSLLVPGSRNEGGAITLAVPNGFYGLDDTQEAQSLVFEFVDENGERTSNSVMGYWDFGVEEVVSTSSTDSYVMLSRMDDLWGFARDWHDSAAVFVANESGEDTGSLTLHRAKEGVEALANCWSGTED